MNPGFWPLQISVLLQKLLQLCSLRSQHNQVVFCVVPGAKFALQVKVSQSSFSKSYDKGILGTGGPRSSSDEGSPLSPKPVTGSLASRISSDDSTLLHTKRCTPCICNLGAGLVRICRSCQNLLWNMSHLLSVKSLCDISNIDEVSAGSLVCLCIQPHVFSHCFEVELATDISKLGYLSFWARRL